MWPKELTDEQDHELQLSDDLVAASPTGDTTPEAIIDSDSVIVHQHENAEGDVLPVYEDAAGSYVVPTGRMFVQAERDATGLKNHLQELGLVIDSVMSFDKR